MVAPSSEEAPQGTIALAFTDIEGSTPLWERHAEAMDAALRLHDGLFRAAIAEFGGYEVKTEGDSFMVVFADPAAAVRWAVALQERLFGADWPAALLSAPECAPAPGFRGPRIRMGIHVGAPILRTDPASGRADYFGPVVNRAARVGSSGHGGQIVVSGAVVEAVRGVAGVVTPLGKHRLKGLREPEVLFQVLPSSLAERQFPALRTGAPEDGPDLLGRSVEGAVRALLSPPYRLAVTGPPGCGKSTLARAIAEHPDVAARADRLLWHRHPAPWPDDPGVDAIVVIDGIDDFGPVVHRTIQQRWPNRLVIVTAREVSCDVRVWAVPRADPEAASRLLAADLDRRGVAPASPEVLGVVAARCLPDVRALQVCAFAATRMGPAALARALGALRDPMPGDRAMRVWGAVATREEKELLDAVSWMPAGFTEEAALALGPAGASRFMGEVLDDLVSAGLVEVREGRHRLTGASPRADAAPSPVLAPSLQGEWRQTVWARRSDGVAWLSRRGEERVAELDGPEFPRAWPWLVAELDNLRAAWRIAPSGDQKARLGLVVERVLRGEDGRATEREEVLQDAVRNGTGLVRVRALVQRSDLQLFTRASEALADAEEALRLATELGDAEWQARASLASARAVQRRSHGAGARHELEAAADLLAAAGLPVPAALARTFFANELLRLGRVSEADRLYDEAIEALVAVGSPRCEAIVRSNRGNLRVETLRLDDARSDYLRCLDLARRSGNRVGLAIATGNLATLDQRAGRLSAADLGLRQALRLWQGSEDPHAQFVRCMFALLQHEQGRPEQAWRTVDHALRTWRNLAEVRAVQRRLGLVDEADRKAVTTPAVVSLLCARVRLARALGHEPVPLAREALAEAGSPLERLEALVEVAASRAASGMETAGEALAEAETIASCVSIGVATGLVAAGRAVVLAREGRPEEALGVAIPEQALVDPVVRLLRNEARGLLSGSGA